MIPLLLAMIQGTATSAPMPLTVTEIVDHLVQADNARMPYSLGTPECAGTRSKTKNLRRTPTGSAAFTSSTGMIGSESSGCPWQKIPGGSANVRD